MTLLTGMTEDGTEVPVQVKPDGRLVAEGLTGPAGPAGSQGPAGGAASISGTAALPGLAAVGDPDTGLYSPGPDQLAISAGGVESASFTAGGGRLANGSIIFSPYQIALTGAGASSVISATKSGVDVIQMGVNAGGCFVSTIGPLSILTGSPSIEKVRITSDGNLLVGTPGALANGPVSGGGHFAGGIALANGTHISFDSGNEVFTGQQWSSAAGQNLAVQAGSAGGVTLASAATSWAATSDERLKADLEPIADGLEKVATLRAVTGRYKADEVGTSRSFLIAQDVQAVLPEAVSGTTDDDDQLSLRYTEVIPLLVAALKEAKERIEMLEQRLDESAPI